MPKTLNKEKKLLQKKMLDTENNHQICLHRTYNLLWPFS